MKKDINHTIKPISGLKKKINRKPFVKIMYAEIIGISIRLNQK